RIVLWRAERNSVKPYYDHAGITIYHGDCLEILPQLEPVDLVLTDPPYNCGKDYGVYKDNLPKAEYHSFMAKTAKIALSLALNQFWVAPRYQLTFFLSLFPHAHLIVIT
ncbi:unnamed protein product, partial [marine sediment metagenome]